MNFNGLSLAGLTAPLWKKGEGEITFGSGVTTTMP